MSTQAYRCYQASKRFRPTGHYPFLIIVAQKESGTAFSEHYVFTGLESSAFLHGSLGYEPGRSVGVADFDRIITFDSLLESEFERAKANLESTVFQMDKELHREIFWSGSNLFYSPVTENAFVGLAIRSDVKRSITDMFELTQSVALDPLKALWKLLSRINIQAD